jgi:hypothetical protein
MNPTLAPGPELFIDALVAIGPDAGLPIKAAAAVREAAVRETVYKHLGQNWAEARASREIRSFMDSRARNVAEEPGGELAMIEGYCVRVPADEL